MSGANPIPKKNKKKRKKRKSDGSNDSDGAYADFKLKLDNERMADELRLAQTKMDEYRQQINTLINTVQRLSDEISLLRNSLAEGHNEEDNAAWVAENSGMAMDEEETVVLADAGKAIKDGPLPRASSSYASGLASSTDAVPGTATEKPPPPKATKASTSSAGALAAPTNMTTVTTTDKSPAPKATKTSFGSGGVNTGAVPRAPAPVGSSDTTMAKGVSGRLLPAITLYNVGVREATTILLRHLKKEEFVIKLAGKSSISIRVRGLENFERIKGLLKERGYEAHTHTPRELLPYSILIVGLSREFTKDEVRDFFSSLEFKVVFLDATNVSPDKWVVRLGRDTDVERLYKVDLMLHCKVVLRKSKGRDITQCFNCQRFSHVSANCTMRYRCVKCAGSHGPGNCGVPPKGQEADEGQQSTEAGDSQLRCANCDVAGHAASSRTCPSRQALLRKVTERKQVAQDKARARTTRLSNLNSGVSYASAARSHLGAPQSRAPQRAAHFEDFSARDRYLPDPLGVPRPGMEDIHRRGRTIAESCRDYFGRDLMSVMASIREFGPEFDRLEREGNGPSALLGLLMHIQGF